MILKWMFDRLAALMGLLIIWPGITGPATLKYRLEMIFATVLGRKVEFAGEEI